MITKIFRAIWAANKTGNFYKSKILILQFFLIFSFFSDKYFFYYTNIIYQYLEHLFI